MPDGLTRNSVDHSSAHSVHDRLQSPPRNTIEEIDALSNDFAWPPPEDDLDREVVGAGCIDVTSTAGMQTGRPPLGRPHANDPVAALKVKTAPPPLRTRDARVRAVTAWYDQQAARSSAAAVATVRWLRTNRVTIALLALALLASLEGVYILRMASTRATPASTLSISPVATAAPSQERAPVAALPTPRSSPAASNSAPATVGTVSIRSEPAGVQVIMDGRLHGLTPLILKQVIAGEHRLTLKQGGSEVRQTIRVAAGTTLSVVVPFQTVGAASGWLTVSTPIELDIFEKGALVGTTRSKQIMVPAGLHTLDLVNDKLGYRTTQEVKIDAGAQKTVAVHLPVAELRVNAKPWAEVWIDGERVGETPMANLKLPIGDHQVTLKHPELGEKTITATIKVGDTTRVTADLQADGRPGR
jgi:hypothetical protein